MPDDFDFSQLPKNETFKAMSLADKYGYLSHVSPTFQKMAPEDQQGYVQHLTGGPAPTAATISAEPDKKGFAGEAGTLRRIKQRALPVARTQRIRPTRPHALVVKEWVQASRGPPYL